MRSLKSKQQQAGWGERPELWVFTELTEFISCFPLWNPPALTQSSQKPRVGHQHRQNASRNPVLGLKNESRISWEWQERPTDTGGRTVLWSEECRVKDPATSSVILRDCPDAAVVIAESACQKEDKLSPRFLAPKPKRGDLRETKTTRVAVEQEELRTVDPSIECELLHPPSYTDVDLALNSIHELWELSWGTDCGLGRRLATAWNTYTEQICVAWQSLWKLNVETTIHRTLVRTCLVKYLLFTFFFNCP